MLFPTIFFVMGNNQSTPQTEARRPPKKLAKAPKISNRLTKPKTNNSTSNLLTSSVPSTPSRRNSQTLPPQSLAPVPPPNKRLSTFSSTEGVVIEGEVIEGEVTQKDEPPKEKKKRTSIFRSRSSHKSVKNPEVDTNIEPENQELSLADQWSRRNSLTYELPVDDPYYSRPSDV